MVHTLDDALPPGSDIISPTDLEGPFFDHLPAKEFNLFNSYLPKLAGSHFLWITKAIQLGDEDPRFSLILGMTRMFGYELGHRFATLELDEFDETALIP